MKAKSKTRADSPAVASPSLADRNREGADKEEQKLNIVYLAGTGRSGSTLIERILETHHKVASAGELGLLWFFATRIGVRPGDIPCPCGARLADCPHWNAVFKSAGFTESGIRELIDLQSTVYRVRNFPVYFIPILNRKLKKRINKLARHYERFYHAIAAVTGAVTIIDASKLPWGPLILKRIPGVNVYVKHLVRRPEGFVLSWATVKYHAGFGGAPTNTRPPVKAALQWLFLNLMVETLRFVMPVRRYTYEWFTEKPRQRIKELMQDVATFESNSSTAFESEFEITFPAGHALLGNPDRFTSGKTVIRRDERYRTALPLRDRILTIALTLPLFILYGYAWRSGKGRQGRTRETRTSHPKP